MVGTSAPGERRRSGGCGGGAKEHPRLRLRAEGRRPAVVGERMARLALGRGLFGGAGVRARRAARTGHDRACAFVRDHHPSPPFRRWPGEPKRSRATANASRCLRVCKWVSGWRCVPGATARPRPGPHRGRRRTGSVVVDELAGPALAAIAPPAPVTREHQRDDQLEGLGHLARAHDLLVDAQPLEQLGAKRSTSTRSPLTTARVTSDARRPSPKATCNPRRLARSRTERCTSAARPVAVGGTWRSLIADQ
jgi:hypothetical protein